MRTIGQLLKNNPFLSKIIDQANDLEKLGVIFRNSIDKEFQDHCALARITQDQLQLHVIIDSAAWATKFRYAIPDLLKQLNAQPEFRKVNRINYHISAGTKASF